MHAALRLLGALTLTLLPPASARAQSPATAGSPLPRPTAAAGDAACAQDLHLASGLSFEDDSSDAFPIVARNAASGRPSARRPTVVFFGSAHCYNTNREAERVVALYARHRDDVCFLVVDLHDVAPEQKDLVRRFYRGYIPTLAVLDAQGRVVFNQSGETASRRGDVAALEGLVARAGAG